MLALREEEGQCARGRSACWCSRWSSRRAATKRRPANEVSRPPRRSPRRSVAWTSEATSWRGRARARALPRSSRRLGTTPPGRARTSTRWGRCRTSAGSAHTTAPARGRAIPARRGCTLRASSRRQELHAVLEGAAIPPPYVLVAHSYGGFIARLFAATYAQETAGMVLIDSSHEDEIEPYRRYYGNSPEGDWVDGGDLIDIGATGRALRATARNYGEMPLVVIKAGRYEDVLTVALWDRTQADLATLSSNSVLVQARGGHFVMNDDPQVVLPRSVPWCRALVPTTVAGLCRARRRNGRRLPMSPAASAGSEARRRHARCAPPPLR